MGKHSPPTPLVTAALTALHQGMNPLAAVVFAINQAYGLDYPTPPGGSPPAPPIPPMPPGSSGGGQGGGSGPPSGTGPPPPGPPKPPPPKPPPPPPPAHKCPPGWYWNADDAACRPIRGTF